MLLTGHKSRAIFDRYHIVNEQELHGAGAQLAPLSGAAGGVARNDGGPGGRPDRPAAPALRLVR